MHSTLYLASRTVVYGMGKDIYHPINSKIDIPKKEEGYVLSVTLVVMALVLMLVASGFKQVNYNNHLGRTVSETSSTQLSTQDRLVSEEGHLLSLYNQLQGESFMQYVELYPLHEERMALYQVLGAAKAYILTTKSFFTQISLENYLEPNQLQEGLLYFRTPSLEQGAKAEMTCRKYTGDIVGAHNPSAGYLVAYQKVRKKVQEIEDYLKTENILETEDEVARRGSEAAMAQTLERLLINQPMYELVVLTEVKNSKGIVTNREKIYASYQLVKQTNATSRIEGNCTYLTLPYRLQVYDYRVVRIV
ncbi:MAG: hypothetical protein RR448_05700 [Niameybacter sp.]